MKTTPPTAPPRYSPRQLAYIDAMNFDESKVAAYDLPAALQMLSGEPVTSDEQWRQERRPEVMRLFRQHVYGQSLPALPHTAEVVEEGEAYGGLAIRRQVEIGFAGWDRKIDLIIYRPKATTGPVPCFLGLGFFGNEANFSDPAVRIGHSWLRPGEGQEGNASSEATRGTKTYRWPVEEILQRGYALAVAYYGDIEPDYPGSHDISVRSLFPPNDAGDAPQAIATWAWGLSRLLDYLESVPEIDAKRVIATGHSRLGKTALWAAASDERFAAVVSNNSGCGGAALSRRKFGETLEMLSNVRTYWFCPNAATDSASDATMPVDQHLLLAAIAPRPVMVSSAEDDRGADPRGEFLSTLHASEVYELLGAGSLGVQEIPPLNCLTGERLCYAIRPGKHDILPEDWAMHLDFADRFVRARQA